MSALPFAPPLAPMLARLARELPAGDYAYEPKWDGFRCLAFAEPGRVDLRSRHGRPLARYFPELTRALAALPRPAILDGEIVVSGPGGAGFPELLARLHPSPSRVARLARETPAAFMAFDLLAEGGEDLRTAPFSARRARLEALLALAPPPLHLTPWTPDPAVARGWLERLHGPGALAPGPGGALLRPGSARRRRGGSRRAGGPPVNARRGGDPAPPRPLDAILAGAGLAALPELSGGRGLHLHAPLGGGEAFARTKAFARAVAGVLAREDPRGVTDRMPLAERAGKVLVDWRQNDAGRSLIAPYSLRAAPAPLVAAPLRWAEVEAVAAGGRPPRIGPADALARLALDGDLLAGAGAPGGRVPPTV